MKILIFGLPGSGKTTLAKQLISLLTERLGGFDEHIHWYNADKVREMEDDWDFSEEGRLRQFDRMKDLADTAAAQGNIVICDFICPKRKFRSEFEADYTIFVDTIARSEYEDTNLIFERSYSSEINFQVIDWNDHNAQQIMWDLFEDEFDQQKPTAQMLGRFQPWHQGHQALFERALDKVGQVYLMVRDMPVDENNPHTVNNVIDNLHIQLAAYAGLVRIEAVPNITHISYGRKVGYTIEQEHFSEEIENISATEIRKDCSSVG